MPQIRLVWWGQHGGRWEWSLILQLIHLHRTCRVKNAQNIQIFVFLYSVNSWRTQFQLSWSFKFRSSGRRSTARHISLRVHQLINSHWCRLFSLFLGRLNHLTVALAEFSPETGAESIKSLWVWTAHFLELLARAGTWNASAIGKAWTALILLISTGEIGHLLLNTFGLGFQELLMRSLLRIYW